MKLVLLFLILARIVTAESFIDGAARYSVRSEDFQRIYAKRALKRVRTDYLEWIRKSSEKQLRDHLVLSYFGTKLYKVLDDYTRLNSQLPTSNWIKDTYYSIVYYELLEIEDFLEVYFSSEQFQDDWIELTKKFLARYQSAIAQYARGVLDIEAFQSIEKNIGDDLKKAQINNQTKEAIRIYLFLQFQSEGPGLWH